MIYLKSLNLNLKHDWSFFEFSLSDLYTQVVFCSLSSHLSAEGNKHSLAPGVRLHSGKVMHLNPWFLPQFPVNSVKSKYRETLKNTLLSGSLWRCGVCLHFPDWPIRSVAFDAQVELDSTEEALPTSIKGIDFERGRKQTSFAMPVEFSM